MSDLAPSTANTDKQTGHDLVKRILALDLGIGSYGIALQERSGEGDAREYNFPVVRSCILPGDWAALDEVRTNRRMWRTRQAHKQREQWLREVFRNAGLSAAVLEGRRVKQVEVQQYSGDGKSITKKQWMLDPDHPADYRLEREFPPKMGEKTKDGAPSDEAGAKTVYCGAALRCLLLLGESAQKAVQGRVLEDWQVFKALHSAIQKRGYDPRVPWQRAATVQPADTEDGVKPGKKAKKTKASDDEVAKGDATVISEKEPEEQKENQASEARANTMQSIAESLHEDTRYHHPCFWEAYQMGLWKHEQPETVSLKQDHHARSCKWADRDDPAQALKPAGQRDKYARLPAIFPRRMVECELMQLCEAAASLLPGLKGKAAEMVYGPTGMAYPNIPRRDEAAKAEEEKRRAALSALPEEQRKKFVRGKQAEWMGALSQKAPTFDNRGPSPCVLIPRFNVAKCDIRIGKDQPYDPDSLLASEVSFLLQLKNFRFTPEAIDESVPGGFRDWLTAKEIARLFNETFLPVVVPRILKSASGALTKKDLSNWMSTHIGPKTTPKPGLDGKGKEIIETPRRTGRARLSRPGLRMVKELVLSGMSPADFKAALLDVGNPQFQTLRDAIKLTAQDSTELNPDPMKGVTIDDLKCLDHIGASWQKLSIRDERLEEFNSVSEKDAVARQNAITRMISAEVNPKIRHRLTLLDHMLTDFMKDGLMPDRVVLEFAREEWLGPVRRKELMDFQNERKEQNISARMKLGAETGARGILKNQLCEEQGGRCLFCGGNFSSPDTTSVVNGELSYEQAHLAHIVAESKGGPRAYVNLVLACDACNRAQGNLYHAEAFAQRQFQLGWDTFCAMVGGLSSMRPFKKKILTTKSQEEAAEMVQNKTSLQETAWIAKLARTLVCLKFGWRLDAQDQEKRVVVVTGSVTNRVASRYKLYSLLGGEQRVQKLADEAAKIRDAMAKVDAAADEEIEKVGDELVKNWKHIKKRKGDTIWDRGYLIWHLRRLQIANDDAINEKDRKDDRHHALDAMVLSFLPHWAGDPGKSLFFGLPPKKNWLGEFGRILNGLYPEVLITAPPKLEQSFYGARRVGPGTVATKRYGLREMAYSGITPKFTLSTLEKQARRIFDEDIKQAVVSFVNGKPTEGDWLAFCERLAKDGIKPGGPRVVNVRRIVSDELTEYADFSKDGSGAWRRGDSNQGWFVCEKSGEKGGYAVEPVYVHQSKDSLKVELLQTSKYAAIVDYYLRNEVVSLAEPVDWIGDPIPAGSYVIKSMRLDGQVYLATNEGYDFKPTSVTNLIKCGLRKGK